MIEFRTPTEEDREQVAGLLRVALNFGPDWVRERAPTFDLSRYLCAYESGRVLATAAARSFGQWFGGREVPMSGIHGVATVPEYRGAGLAVRTIEQLLHQAREREVPLSGLYPATLHVYRRLGFEIAGSFVEQSISLDDLPSGPGPLPVEEYRPGEDLEGVRACYRRVASAQNGPIDCNEEDWWPARILSHPYPEEVARAVVARGEGGTEGYAAFVYDKAEGELSGSFAISCKHLVASTEAGLRSLLGYFRGYRGLGQDLKWISGHRDPIALLVDEQRVKSVWTFRWMNRVLDVPGAFERRGYPPVSGEAVISVDDPTFADNRGPWRIEADGGAVRVTRADGPADAGRRAPRPIPIGALSSMYTGYLSPYDAVRLGYLDAGDPAAPFLAHLLTGPEPFMYDFF